jgi:hypothetical protein
MTEPIPPPAPSNKRWLIISAIAGCGCLLIVALILGAAGLIAFAKRGDLPHVSSGSGDCPSEEEVRETIDRKFHDLYFQDYGFAKVANVTIDVGPITMGNTTLKQVEYGKDAQPVCPVRTVVHVHVTYSNNPSDRDLTRGDKSDDMFFFYKDSFDQWTFKTGSD